MYNKLRSVNRDLETHDLMERFKISFTKLLVALEVFTNKYKYTEVIRKYIYMETTGRKKRKFVCELVRRYKKCDRTKRYRIEMKDDNGGLLLNIKPNKAYDNIIKETISASKQLSL